MTMIVILDNEYHGFEAAVDIERDISEMFQYPNDPAVHDIPGEYQGTIRVTVTYTPPEDDVPVCVVEQLRNEVESQILDVTANMTCELRRRVLLSIAQEK